MTLLVDASVAVRWFVAQPGAEVAAEWLRRFARDPGLFVTPDLFRFEVHGALARLQSARDFEWGSRCFDRMDRLGIRTVPTSIEIFRRAMELSREIPLGGYDAIYLAHAESIGIPWLTADEKVLRRLAGDERVQALVPSA